MAWAQRAARLLAETFAGAFDADGVVVAAAGVDPAGPASLVSPGPADGRFEIGSVTKTMTATLLALLAAEGTLSLDDEVGRWLPAGANPAIRVRSTAASVCPGRRKTPPSRAIRGNTWPGRT